MCGSNKNCTLPRLLSSSSSSTVGCSSSSLTSFSIARAPCSIVRRTYARCVFAVTTLHQQQQTEQTENQINENGDGLYKQNRQLQLQHSSVCHMRKGDVRLISHPPAPKTKKKGKVGGADRSQIRDGHTSVRQYNIILLT